MSKYKSDAAPATVNEQARQYATGYKSGKVAKLTSNGTRKPGNQPAYLVVLLRGVAYKLVLNIPPALPFIHFGSGCDRINM